MSPNWLVLDPRVADFNHIDGVLYMPPIINTEFFLPLFSMSLHVICNYIFYSSVCSFPLY